MQGAHSYPAPSYPFLRLCRARTPCPADMNTAAPVGSTSVAPQVSRPMAGLLSDRLALRCTSALDMWDQRCRDEVIDRNLEQPRLGCMPAAAHLKATS